MIGIHNADMIYVQQKIMKPIQSEYDKTNVTLQNGSWNSSYNTGEIKRMQEWEVEELHAEYNHRTNILADISHLHFTNLSALWVAGNMIESVEGLSSLYMPQISKLYLRYNNISSIRGLRKAQWPRLWHLWMGNNYIGDASTLPEAHLPRLEYLELYYMYLEKNKACEKRFPYKLQTPSLKYLCFFLFPIEEGNKTEDKLSRQTRLLCPVKTIQRIFFLEKRIIIKFFSSTSLSSPSISWKTSSSQKLLSLSLFRVRSKEEGFRSLPCQFIFSHIVEYFMPAF